MGLIFAAIIPSASASSSAHFYLGIRNPGQSAKPRYVESIMFVSPSSLHKGSFFESMNATELMLQRPNLPQEAWGEAAVPGTIRFLAAGS